MRHKTHYTPIHLEPGLPIHAIQREWWVDTTSQCEHATYDWGFVLQRRAQQYVIYDYCFDGFYRHRHGAPNLHTLQAEISRLIHNTHLFKHGIYGLLSGTRPWVLLSSDVGAFSLVAHIQHEQEAYDWSTQTLVFKLIPTILQRYQAHACD
ncbi:MAG: hypothetical protein K0U68_14275 [Gammaproteobacteria bacterium]|nr:hypothetical protein [Gammaproteobacteria bacterium]